MTSYKTQKNKKRDDSPLSENNGKAIRYRKRLLEQEEAQKEIKKYNKEMEEFYENYGGTD